jgi:hypothetical protein
VSRRREMKMYAKRWEDLRMKRLHLVCTGSGRHGIVTLAPYQREVNPERPDREGVQRLAATSHLGEHGGIPGCRKCGSEPREFTAEQHAAVLAALEVAVPGRVLRWDISTGRLLT